MAIRVEPDIADTDDIIAKVLVVVLGGDGTNRVSFLVPAGTGENVCARVRTAISRLRKRLSERKRNPKRFILHSSIHPETHEGRRMDCIVMWKHHSDSTILLEAAEELMARHG